MINHGVPVVDNASLHQDDQDLKPGRTEGDCDEYDGPEGR